MENVGRDGLRARMIKERSERAIHYRLVMNTDPRMIPCPSFVFRDHPLYDTRQGPFQDKAVPSMGIHPFCIGR